MSTSNMTYIYISLIMYVLIELLKSSSILS